MGPILYTDALLYVFVIIVPSSHCLQMTHYVGLKKIIQGSFIYKTRLDSPDFNRTSVFHVRFWALC